MIRNLKSVGLMTVAAFALSAMVAAAVQAEGAEGQFNGGPATNRLNTTVIGNQIGTEEEDFFEFLGAKTTCKNAGVSFAGTLTGGKGTDLTITPSYTQCSAGGLPMTVTMNGCTYTLTQPTTITEGRYTGQVDLTCPTNVGPQVHVYANAGHTIQVCKTETLPGTHTGLGAETHYVQAWGGHAVYTNKASTEVTAGVKRDDVHLSLTATEIPMTRHAGFVCGEGKHLAANAVYSSQITLIGKDDVNDSPNPTEHSEHYDVWLSHHETEGAAKGVTNRRGSMLKMRDEDQ